MFTKYYLTFDVLNDVDVKKCIGGLHMITAHPNKN